MPLFLTIRNFSELSNGSPITLVLDRRGALIGRSATTDWCLPDPALHISSRHCEVRFEGDRYHLIDHSTNGTFLFGEGARLASPRVIDQGDVFLIGEYEIEASLDETSAAALAAERQASASQPREWQGWNAAGGGNPAAPPPQDNGGWGAGADVPSAQSSGGGWGNQAPASVPPPAPSSGSAGWGPTPKAGSPDGWGAPAQDAAGVTPSSSWGPSGSTPAPTPPSPSHASGWGQSSAPAPPPPSPSPPASPAASGGGWGPPAGESAGWAPAPKAAEAPVQSPWSSGIKDDTIAASGWSSPVSNSPPSQSNDIWGKIAQSNVVDWARGGFGKAAQPAPQSSGPPRGSVASAHFAPPVIAPDPSAAQPDTPAPPAPAPPPPPPASGEGLRALATAAGLDPGKFSQPEAATLSLAGDLMRRLVSGLVVMMEARARAKAQLGAQGTSLEFDGNNPLKFARSPEQALAQLLNPPERGFMGSERAIEDAFKDLQAHQMATLMAMQGALRATLERFSPSAIRSRAENKGMLAKVLPTARDAALWKAYEREFSGVAQGSDEAFMDVFAKEFKKAYEEVAHQRG